MKWPMKKKIHSLILIGYRATGKTTIARLLGEHLDIASVDSDLEIERKTGKNIAEIFAEQGESGFRDLEFETIAELLDRNQQNDSPLVLSTGGGAILRPETRQRLRESGHVVWLTASPETIWQRMQDDSATESTRPNLTNLPPLEEIIALLEFRYPFYQETAHQTIDSEQFNPQTIVQKIIDQSARFVNKNRYLNG